MCESNPHCHGLPVLWVNCSLVARPKGTPADPKGRNTFRWGREEVSHARLLLQGIAISCAFKQLLFVWFGFNGTWSVALLRPWTNIGPIQSLFALLSISGASALLQQPHFKYLWEQARGVGSSTDINWSASPALCLGPLPHVRLFYWTFPETPPPPLHPPSPPLPSPLYCLPPFRPLKYPCLYYCFHTAAASQEKLSVAGANGSTHHAWSLSTAHDRRFTWSDTACVVLGEYDFKQTVQLKWKLLL